MGQRSANSLPPATSLTGHMSILPKPLPPLELLQELFYVSETSPSGLRWKNPKTSRHKPGMVAGTHHHTGYWEVKITTDRSRIYRVLRVVYFLQTSENPGLLQVDHVNGLTDPLTLRLATKNENLWTKSPQKNSNSRYKGISWDNQHKKWRVRITKNKKRIDIGRFVTEKDAAVAYNKAALEHHGEFAKLNKVE